MTGYRYLAHTRYSKCLFSYDEIVRLTLSMFLFQSRCTRLFIPTPTSKIQMPSSPSAGSLVPSLLDLFPIKRMHFTHSHMDHAAASVSSKSILFSSQVCSFSSDLQLTHSSPIWSLANAEMHLVLAEFLWHFDLELQAEFLHWSVQNSFSLWSRPALWVKLRHPDTAL